LARSVLLVDSGIFAGCATVLWLGGWRTLYDYGNALVLAGTTIVCLGAAGVLAAWARRPRTEQQHHQAATSDQLRELMKQALESRRRHYNFMVHMAITGAIPIFVGTLIQRYLP
jgi:hypothetical protein